MTDNNENWFDRQVGIGMKIFAGTMTIVWIGGGCFAIFRGLTEEPWYIAALGVGAIIYGLLWANVVRTGRLGRFPLWL